MWSCAKNRKHLNAYIDGELPNNTCREVEHHLAQCPACRIEFDGLRGLEPLLKSVEVPSVPAKLLARIVAEAALRQKRKEAKTSGREWRAFLFQPWLVRGAPVAALIVGLAMGALMGWASYLRPGSPQWITSNENAPKTLYAFDVLGAEPRGSIEAATLALLDDRR